MLQENKARQISEKLNIFYPLIPTRTCAHQRVRKGFEIRPLSYNQQKFEDFLAACLPLAALSLFFDILFK